MTNQGQLAPPFHPPKEFLLPQITELLSDQQYIENGISFKGGAIKKRPYNRITI